MVDRSIEFSAGNRFLIILLTAGAVVFGWWPMISAPRGHLRPWRSSTMYSDIARVAPMIGGIFTSFLLELLVYPGNYEIWK
jgi:Cu/Ag efflux pump CusA